MSSIKIIKGGPFVVTGNFQLDIPGSQSKEFNEKTYLCRCGESKKKPFCDGAHAKSSFDR